MRISDWSSDVCSSDLVEALGGRAQVEHHALFAMQSGEEAADSRTERTRHRHFVRRHHVHLQAARVQRAGGFQADEPGPAEGHPAPIARRRVVWESRCQSVMIRVVAASFKKKKK